MFRVISVYFNIRNTLPKSGTFLLGHPVYKRTKSRIEGCIHCSLDMCGFITFIDVRISLLVDVHFMTVSGML